MDCQQTDSYNIAYKICGAGQNGSKRQKSARDEAEHQKMMERGKAHGRALLMAAYTYYKEQMLEQKNTMKKQEGEGDLLLGPLHVGRLLGIGKVNQMKIEKESDYKIKIVAFPHHDVEMKNMVIVPPLLILFRSQTPSFPLESNSKNFCRSQAPPGSASNPY